MVVLSWEKFTLSKQTTLDMTNEKFTFEGQAVLGTTPIRSHKCESGWLMKTFSIGIKQSASNCPWASINFGNFEKDELDMSNATEEQIKEFDEKTITILQNATEDGKYPKKQIKNKERFDKDIIDSVPNFCKVTISLELDSAGNLIDREFIRQGDAVDYILKHLQKNAKVRVWGTTKRKRAINKKTNEVIVYETREIKGMTLVSDEDYNPTTTSNTTFYFDSNAIDESRVDTDNEAVITGYHVQSIGKDPETNKKILDVIPVEYILSSSKFDFTNPEHKMSWDFLLDVFECQKGEIRKTQWLYKVLDGNESLSKDADGEPVELELTDKLKTAVKLKLMTEEVANAIMRKSQQDLVGDKIKKLYLIRPNSIDFSELVADKVSSEELVSLSLSNGVDTVTSKVDDNKAQEAQEKLNALDKFMQ